MLSLALFILLFADPSIVRITEQNSATGGVALSADGNTIYFTKVIPREGESLWMRQGVESRKLLGDAKLGGRITLSPDGRSVYFLRADPQLPWVNMMYQWTSGSGEPRKLLDRANSLPGFSPGGKSFAYIRNPGRNVRQLILNEGGGERKVAEWIDLNIEVHNIAWSPDGGQIACVDNGALMFVPLHGGEIRHVAAPQVVTGLVWPQGAGPFALLNDGHSGSQIWQFQMAGARWTQLTHDEYGFGQYQISASADGSTLAATQYHGDRFFGESAMRWLGIRVPLPFDLDVVLIRGLR